MIRYVQWWRHNTPLPPGARYADGSMMDSHHRHHASLIEHDKATVIALEHIAWCKRRRMTRHDICREMGIRSADVKSRDDLICEVAALWLTLARPEE